MILRKPILSGIGNQFATILVVKNNKTVAKWTLNFPKNLQNDHKAEIMNNLQAFLSFFT